MLKVQRSNGAFQLEVTGFPGFSSSGIEVLVPNPVWYYVERQHAEILTLK